MKNQFYQFSAKSLQGSEIKMENYKGKAILVVNTASKCGLTPQYEGLENLYQKYKDKGLVILGFPCNQFGNQESGDEKSISEGCLINYGVSFPMFSKIEVNGENAHPIYKYLKKEKGDCLAATLNGILPNSCLIQLEIRLKDSPRLPHLKKSTNTWKAF